MSAGLATVLGIIILVGAVLVFLEIQEKKEKREAAVWHKAFNEEPAREVVTREELEVVYDWREDELKEIARLNHVRQQEALKRKARREESVANWLKSRDKFHRDLRTGGLAGARARERKEDQN